MACLWRKNADCWSAKVLDGAGNALIAGAMAATSADADATRTTNFRIVPFDAAGVKVWALISSHRSDVRVNGAPVTAGMRVLADRDEIRIDGEVQYFSTESLAEVVPLPATERTLFCGRCRLKIETGSPAVCCPSCGISFHQSGHLPCWTYSERCAFCSQETSLDAGFAWTPEED